MALNTKITTTFGLELTDVYVRVTDIRLLNKEQMSFTASCFYVNPETNSTPIMSFGYSCSYTLESNLNAFQQAYEYIKTLPEWEDAVDC